MFTYTVGGKVTCCTALGEQFTFKTWFSFNPAISLLESFPYRYTHTNVQRQMQRWSEKHTSEVKKKKMETTYMLVSRGFELMNYNATSWWNYSTLKGVLCAGKASCRIVCGVWLHLKSVCICLEHIWKGMKSLNNHSGKCDRWAFAEVEVRYCCTKNAI